MIAILYLNPPQRAVILLRRWVVLSLIVCTSVISGCKSELFSRIDESEANAVMLALYIEGITATKVPVDENFWRIEVNRQDQQRAMAVARNHGVPRGRFVNMGDLFKNDGLVSTPSEVRMRYVFALSQELSNTLSQIDGVISARVHPVIPVNDPLSDKIQLASAAVFIKHLPDSDLRVMAPAIKNLIVRSIDNLKPENVSVTFFAAPAPVLPVSPEYSSLLTDNQAASVFLILIPTILLALTWGVFGWRMWSRPVKRESTENFETSSSTQNNSTSAQNATSDFDYFYSSATGSLDEKDLVPDTSPAFEGVSPLRSMVDADEKDNAKLFDKDSL